MLSSRNNAEALTGLGVVSSSSEFMSELEQSNGGVPFAQRRYDAREDTPSISPLESASNTGVKQSKSRGNLSPPDLLGLRKVCEAVGAKDAGAVVASYAVMYEQYCQAFATQAESVCDGECEPSVDSLTAVDMLRDAGLSVMSLGVASSGSDVARSKGSSVTSSRVCRASVKHAVSKYPSGLCYARVFRITARESVALALGFWPTFFDMLSQPVEAALPLCATSELFLRRVDDGWHLIDALDEGTLDLSYNKAIVAVAVTHSWPVGTYGAALASVPVVEPSYGQELLSINHSLGGDSFPVGRVYSREITEAAERATAVASGNSNPFRGANGGVVSVSADAYYPLPDVATNADDLDAFADAARELGIHSDATDSSGSNFSDSDQALPGRSDLGTRHRTSLPFLSSYSVASGAFNEVSMGVSTPEIYAFDGTRWCTYRRNYSSIVVTLRASSFTQFTESFSTTDRVPLRVTLVAVRRYEEEPIDLSARPVSNVPLLSYTTKRDLGTKETPEPVSVGAMDLMTGCVVKFERIQFARSTPVVSAHGKRCFYHFVIQLEGCFLGRWVPLHRTVSYPVTVRGRSPKYFPPDAPLPADYGSYLEHVASSGAVFAQRTGGVTPTKDSFMSCDTVLGGLLVGDVAKGIVAKVHRNAATRIGVIFPCGGSARFVEHSDLREFVDTGGGSSWPHEVGRKCEEFLLALDSFEVGSYSSYTEVVRAGAFSYEVCW